MFRTSIVHLQEGSYAVCCYLVCLDTSCCYEGEGSLTACKFLSKIYKISFIYRHCFYQTTWLSVSEDSFVYTLALRTSVLTLFCFL